MLRSVQGRTRGGAFPADACASNIACRTVSKTPLITAAPLCCVRACVRARVCVCVPQASALHLAVCAQNADCVAQLLKAKIDASARNFEDYTVRACARARARPCWSGGWW